MQKLFNFLFECEFYLKVALCCTILQQILSFILHKIELNFTSQVLTYWIFSSISFYSISFLIERVIKENHQLTEKLTVRTKKVKKQQFPRFTAKGIALGELKGLIAAFIILYIAPETTRNSSFLMNFGWFLLRIFFADFCFYVAHWLLHRKLLQTIHLKHHEFRDTSSWVAGYKSLLEYAIVTSTDLLPIFIFGYDINQLLAWTLVGNAYNIEGHSSLSIFFIASDFHDLHHTGFHKNYGIQGFWDRVFNTLNPPHKKIGFVFPVASIEKAILKPSHTNS